MYRDKNTCNRDTRKYCQHFGVLWLTSIHDEVRKTPMNITPTQRRLIHLETFVCCSIDNSANVSQSIHTTIQSVS